MPDPLALLRYLEECQSQRVTLRLVAIGALIRWMPQDGDWSTASIIGASGQPTPMLIGLARALEAGWAAGTVEGEPDAISFRRPHGRELPFELRPEVPAFLLQPAEREPDFIAQDDFFIRPLPAALRLPPP